MNTKLKLIALFSFAFFAFAFFTPKGETQTKVETAGQKFKNIKVLNDMPADQMGKVMNLMSASLGVNCSFCHIGDAFEKDDIRHVRASETINSLPQYGSASAQPARPKRTSRSRARSCLGFIWKTALSAAAAAPR
ncbi:MAG: photosynthetic reaction center cytochrome c subunit family protein [Ramlibacter sp.]